MQRIRLYLGVSVIIVLAAASLGFVHFIDLNKPSSNSIAEGRWNGLKLTMSVDKTSVYAGELVHFNLTLKNIGDEDVNLSLGYPPFDVYLYDCYGRILTKYTSGRLFITLWMDFTLKPGENYSQIISWDLGVYNETSGGFDVIKPGEYLVSGVWLDVETRIETSKIRITVLKALGESQAVEDAKEFLLNCETFKFDGIKDSIEVDEAVPTERGWNIRLNFSCAHPGYGNRSGEVLPQVVMSHQICVIIEGGKVTSAIIDDVWDEVAQSYLYTEQKAVETAKEFLLNCPTFKFDGIPESVKVVGVYTLRCPWTWMVEFNFTCRHSGYGNRTGLVLLQVLTDHKISVVVQRGVVARAIIDDVWDEINQKFIGEGDELTVKLTELRDLVLDYLLVNHEEVARLNLTSISWVGELVTDPMLLGYSTFVFRCNMGNVTIGWPVVPNPNYDVTVELLIREDSSSLYVVWKGSVDALGTVNEESYMTQRLND